MVKNDEKWDGSKITSFLVELLFSCPVLERMLAWQWRIILWQKLNLVEKSLVDNSTNITKPSNLLFTDNTQDILTKHQRIHVQSLQYLRWRDFKIQVLTTNDLTQYNI